MAKRNKKKNDETLVDLAEKTEQAKDFYGKNQNMILGVLFAFVLLFGGWYAYSNFYKKPLQMEAIQEMAQAERMFERDSFALALGNPGGGSLGFEEISKKYSGTAAGNLANYYAGVSWMQLGEYKAALAYLKKYNPDGSILPISYYGVLGDVYSEIAYAEKTSMDDAISNYKKAIAQGSNEFLESYYMKKLGLMYEYQGNMAEAKAMFEDLKNKFPNTPEGRDIDKYIARVSVN